MRRQKTIIVLMIVITVAAIVTAGIILYPYPPDQPPAADDTGSTQEGIMAVVTANNQFAFDLYSELAKSEQGNVFYSPYSISSAIAMTYEGAEGKTADEIKSVFYFPENNVLRSNFAAIYNTLNRKGREYQLSTGNALWAQQDYEFLQDYMANAEKYYGGKAVNLDFIKETESSRQTINSFIEAQTNNRIKELLPLGSITSATRLVLTNAIYFKGTWEWEFDKRDTDDRDFKITSENIVKAPMMYMKNDEAEFNYAETRDLQILELPYKGEDISMLILLPIEDLDSIERSLTAEKLEEWKSQMSKEKLDEVYLPKFEFDTKYFMRETLEAMGMSSAFSPGDADFSGMDGTHDLYIDAVVHQAFVKVDEEGTEAAAATGVIMGITSVGPTERKIFRADHPFIFIIQERKTGNILFVGRVIDPRQTE
jgi:serpin B